MAAAQLIAGPNPSAPGPHVVIPQTDVSHPAYDGSVRFDWGDLTPNGANAAVYNANAGPIEKWLTFEQDQDNNGVVDLNDFNFLIANPITLLENISVAAAPGWTGWHEELVTPGWSWTGTPQIVGVPGVFNTTIQSTPTNIDFSFDPLNPTDLISIEKQFSFTALDPTPFINDFFAGTLMVKVLEYPSVPEPTTLALVGLSLPLLLRRYSK